jgi:D-glycero-alpha-D-manno-heptose-7-phosphate kinase
MIISKTPFRLPLGGGGTDLPAYYSQFGGSLITAAINKYMYININQPAIFDKIKIAYNKVELVEPEKIELIKHEIVRETLKYFNIRKPLEIHSMADLPAGTGMGSSSSYTVCLLKSLNAFIRRDITIQELAEEACKIEIDLIGKPIGKQDQYIASFGGIIQMDIEKNGNVTVTPLKLDPEIIHELEHRLLIFYTNIERDANEILQEQSDKIALAEPAQTLRDDFSKKSLRASGADAKHTTVQAMHTIKEIGKEIKSALQNGDITAFGKLIHEHWLTKKSVSTKMSNPDIDKWYNTALQNGALGGKIMGAGGGGFLLLCAKQGQRQQLKTAMGNMGLKFMDFKFDFEGAKVLVNMQQTSANAISDSFHNIFNQQCFYNPAGKFKQSMK